MKALANFIVDTRKIFIILFAVLIAYCVWGMTQVKIEYDITAYLPQDTDTRQALEIMDDEFVTYGTATIMIRNISYEKAKSLHDKIEDIDGVKSFTFENTEDYYKNSCALFKITYEGDGDDDLSKNAYAKTVEMLDGEEIFISVSPTDTYADDLQREINIVLVMAIAVIVLVLLFTSSSYAEVIVFLLTFGMAALLNMGTNYWFGTISFISNSVCVILQLALAIDYAIILSNRFAEEKRRAPGDPVAAMKEALGKAIIEISSSSLTTIAGLLALATMSLRLGADMGFVLAKSIVCSMVTVFFFMPAISLMFSKAVDKTTHKNFVPAIPFVGKLDVKFRYVLVALFFVFICVCGYYSNLTSYVYSQDSIDTSRPSDTQVATARIEEVFGHENEFVILMPGKDYDRQRDLIEKVESYELINSGTGLSNQEITQNDVTYHLTDKINYKQFAELLAVEDTVADSIYLAYTGLCKDTTEDTIREMALYETNKNLYTVSLLDLCDCAFDNDDFISAYLAEDEDSLDSYHDIKDTIEDAEDQLLGNNYSRILFELNAPVESAKTFEFIDLLIKEVKELYPEAIFAGDSMSAYDLNQSFTGDNLKVSLLTIGFVFVILIFTFRSWGLPIPLTATIQTAIFINFSYYPLTNTNLFFFVYLIVSSIQMGATIDYAIVITTRYEELKGQIGKKQAIIESISQAFPTVVTSGTIMAVAGLLIGMFVSDTLIATLGMCLMRGVLISILLVMTVMPALLYVFDGIISKTKFKDKPKKKKKGFPKLKDFLATQLIGQTANNQTGGENTTTQSVETETAENKIENKVDDNNIIGEKNEKDN